MITKERIIYTPSGANPYGSRPLMTINPRDKFLRDVGFNGAESSHFGCICTVRRDQMIDCYYDLDKEVTREEFFELCRECPYANTRARFIRRELNSHQYPHFLNSLDEIDYENPKAFVYFISNGQYVKIGVAKDVKTRLSDLQVGNSSELRLLFSIPAKSHQAAHRIEAILHNEYRHRQIRGEWFDLLTYIRVEQFADYFKSLREEKNDES